MTVNKGDQYVQEIGATVTAVMNLLRDPSETVYPCADPSGNDRSGNGPAMGPIKSPYILSWQSKVGFLPWMGPSTSSTIKGLATQGHKYVLAIPIAFTSDHIETLFEIDMEYKEEAHKEGE